MPSHLRLPTLLLTALSILLALTILITASHSLATFNTNRTENVYFLPIWGSSHLDLRSLSALIGTAVLILLCNLMLVAAMFIPKLPTNALILLSTLLSSILSLIALVFPASLHSHSTSTSTSASASASYPKATLQTYTCSWRHIPHQGVPGSFDSLCHETRLAFYTTIPLLILQLALLGTAVYAFTTTRSANEAKRLDDKDDDSSSSSREHDMEKNGSGSGMGEYEMSQRDGGRNAATAASQKTEKVRVVEVVGKQ
ncbi:hypothetical protein CERZMDRAFT_100675 [Cercospora zeae-maydis SCOH1-5]|uniref:MARVEL domain-containing protein n=1 Tax=Cercospora zeae-maydis SCOH1-5 TaxID=717836 RepID=A0A6A6F3X0_9PEZI|nr:hypothetical protein CERZMDRAFT_100675 [Cercospora zeae-maydis SCOH1-5]